MELFLNKRKTDGIPCPKSKIRKLKQVYITAIQYQPGEFISIIVTIFIQTVTYDSSKIELTLFLIYLTTVGHI